MQMITGEEESKYQDREQEEKAKES